MRKQVAISLRKMKRKKKKKKKVFTSAVSGLFCQMALVFVPATVLHAQLVCDTAASTKWS